jgi:hypothetical protein
MTIARATFDLEKARPMSETGAKAKHSIRAEKIDNLKKEAAKQDREEIVMRRIPSMYRVEEDAHHDQRPRGRCIRQRRMNGRHSALAGMPSLNRHATLYDLIMFFIGAK